MKAFNASSSPFAVAGTLFRCRRATTALEFALAAPAFLAAVGILFQVGIMLYSQTTLDMAARLAARAVQTGLAQ
jgi:Flp pilus assembly protein TadG